MRMQSAARYGANAECWAVVPIGTTRIQLSLLPSTARIVSIFTMSNSAPAFAEASAGNATATPQRVTAGRRKTEVAVLRITDAGRKTLAGMKR